MSKLYLYFFPSALTFSLLTGPRKVTYSNHMWAIPVLWAYCLHENTLILVRKKTNRLEFQWSSAITGTFWIINTVFAFKKTHSWDQKLEFTWTATQRGSKIGNNTLLFCLSWRCILWLWGSVLNVNFKCFLKILENISFVSKC